MKKRDRDSGTPVMDKPDSNGCDWLPCGICCRCVSSSIYLCLISFLNEHQVTTQSLVGSWPPPPLDFRSRCLPLWTLLNAFYLRLSFFFNSRLRRSCCRHGFPTYTNVPPSIQSRQNPERTNFAAISPLIELQTLPKVISHHRQRLPFPLFKSTHTVCAHSQRWSS